MSKRLKRKIYSGFSLIEMLITITILGFVMLLCATVLNSLIKVSTIADYKNSTRNDVNFITEFSKRALGNASLQDIYIYETKDVRQYNPETGQIEWNLEKTDVEILAAYPLPSPDMGTEVHVKVNGYDRWTCIGYFQSTVNAEKWYVVKTSTQSLTDGDHADCFGNTDNIPMVLNSKIVTIKDFKVSKAPLFDGNTLFTIDVLAEPMYWPVGENIPVTKEISKQVTVITQGLTWY